MIVDDGSTDDTRRSLAGWRRSSTSSRPVRAAGRRNRAATSLALAKEARAFNLGLRHAGWERLRLHRQARRRHRAATAVVRDADRALRARAVARAGRWTPARAARPGWELNAIPEHHVHGAVKLYRRKCLAGIGGVAERLGWDTIDEVYARMERLPPHSFGDLVARHHRPYGSADGRLRGRRVTASAPGCSTTGRPGRCCAPSSRPAPAARMSGAAYATATPAPRAPPDTRRGPGVPPFHPPRAPRPDPRQHGRRPPAWKIAPRASVQSLWNRTSGR